MLRHGDVETNDASAATDAGQHETTITNAHPRTATIETTITSAPENCTKNAHFSPAKAMAVSIPHGYLQAKAITVSNYRAWLRCPWAAAVLVGGGGPGRTTSRGAEPHVNTQGPTGAEGAGGTGGHGRASRRGAERSEDA